MVYGGLSSFRVSRRDMKLLIQFLISLFITIFASSIANAGGWMFYTDGPYKGKVLDLETGAPIEGVVVAGVWLVKQYGGPGGPIDTFCDAEETLTNKNGEFKVPRASCWHWWPFSTLGSPQFTVFKPGYLGYPPLGATQEERKARMPEFTGAEFMNKAVSVIKLGRPKTREERIFTLNEAERILFTQEVEIYKEMPNLLRLVNEENKELGFGSRVPEGGRE